MLTCDCQMGALAEFGRSWTVAEDFSEAICDRCKKPMPVSWLTRVAAEFAESRATCAALYRGEKPDVESVDG